VVIRHISDIAGAFGVPDEYVDEATRYLRCEGMSEDEICDAVTKNYLFLGNVATQTFSYEMLEVCRRYAERLPRMSDPNKPSGNPVRDRLLEVGKYNPSSPFYIGDVIEVKKERRERRKKPRFRTWGDI
jgi:hypothetical protein